MRSSARHRRLVSLLAAFVLLVGTIAPTVSAMLGPQRVHSLFEVCTAEGIVLVDAHGRVTDPQPLPSGAHGLEHCPFCGSHAPVLHLPPTSTAALPVTGLTEARPPAFLFAPPTQHAWTSAQPRAPPQAA